MRIKKGDSMGYTILILSGLVAGSSAAFAKTDVKAAMQQLKTNEENAKANYKQYDENSDVASQNIVEATNAVKSVREQRAQLINNAQNLEKNLAILAKMRERLSGYKNDEALLMKKEEQQAQALRAQLERLEANRMKREQNITAYDAKIAEVDKEKADWDQQKSAFTSIHKELDGKEQKALGEREKWIEKRKGYRGEAAKWEKESQVAEQQRVKYEKLRD